MSTESDKILADLEKASAMPFDALRELERSHDEMRDLLIYIIQTLDNEFSSAVQNTSNPIGDIRERVDRLLNK